MSRRAAALRLVAEPAALMTRRTRPARAAAALPSLWPAALAGLVALALVLAGGLGWAMRAQVVGAVTVQGRVQAGLGAVPLRHPEAGIVAALFVADGDRVNAGAELVRLAGADALAELALIEVQEQDIAARIARHRAELALAGASANGTGDPHAEQAPDGPPHHLPPDSVHLAILAVGRALDTGAAAALDTARTAHAAQAAALVRQRAATTRQAALIAVELATQTRLLDQGLAQAGRSLALQREAARLDGVLAEVDAQAARTALVLSELEAAHVRVRADRQRLAAEALAIAQAQLASTRARLPALRDRVVRLTLHAPEGGIVQDIAARPGVLLGPGEPVLWLVPQAPLRIVADLPDRLAGTLVPGQPVRLLLPPGLAGVPDEIAGNVLTVGADARPPGASQPAQFRVVIGLAPEMSASGLLPGMPVNVVITRPARRPIEMLLDPLRGVLHPPGGAAAPIFAGQGFSPP